MNKSWLEEVRLISSSRRSRTLGAFELAPLVDVILMLVIFSLIVTGFIYTPGVQINLPAAKSPNAIRGRTYVITVTEDEKIYIKDMKTPVSSIEMLSPHIREFATHTQDGTVIINADYNVKHGFLINLMDLIRDSGIRKIAFETKY